MKEKIIYKEIKKHIEENEKALFLGEKSLSRALYTAGKLKKKGKEIKSRAIIPQDSSIKTEEEAMRQGKKEDKKEGIPYTTYRIGKIKKEDKKYKTIVDERPNQIQKLEETTKKVKKNGKIILILPIDYIYPLKATYKGFLKEKEKKKTLKEILEDQKLELEKQKILEGEEEIIVKIKNKGFKKKYLSQRPMNLEEMGKEIEKEIMPEIEYAREGSSFCIESEDKELLYHVKKVKETSGETKMKFSLPTGEMEHETEIGGEENKLFKIDVKPNIKKHKEEIKEKDDLIMLKERIKDYYS